MKKVLIAVLIISLAATVFVACQPNKTDNTADTTISDDNQHWKESGIAMRTDSGALIFWSETTGAVVLHPADDTVSFEGIETGDKITAELTEIMETYPAQSTAYSVTKDGEGDISDIPADVIESLEGMNNIIAGKNPAVEGMTIRTKAGEMIFWSESTGPIVLSDNNNGEKDIFDDLTSGDRISVVFDGGIEETYPAHAAVKSIAKTAEGDASDLPGDVIESLSSLGYDIT